MIKEEDILLAALDAGPTVLKATQYLLPMLNDIPNITSREFNHLGATMIELIAVTYSMSSDNPRAAEQRIAQIIGLAIAKVYHPHAVRFSLPGDKQHLGEFVTTILQHMKTHHDEVMEILA